MNFLVASFLLSFLTYAYGRGLQFNEKRNTKSRRETNGERLARGLAPLAPRRLYEPRLAAAPLYYNFAADNELKKRTVYALTDSYIGSDFYSGFNWENIADPTHGDVNYVTQEQAIAEGILHVTASNQLWMGADSNRVIGPNVGRDSQRIRSNNFYTTAVIVLDLAHAPQGCGTWPAFWTTNDDPYVWPASGEIDIIEYVNDVGRNAETVHTSTNCTQPAAGGRDMTGTVVSTNCDVAVNGNQGCSVQSSHSDSSGPAFNAVGGGWWAMERTSSSISIWFWDRTSTTVPASVQNGAATVDTSTFGVPDSTFVDATCDFTTHFGPNNIIFDLTFCGDYAGNVYPSGNPNCPASPNMTPMANCDLFVENNPSAFENAYWLINSLRVYE